MVHEKIFMVGRSREVKVIVRNYNPYQIQPHIEILVRESNDIYFQKPFELTGSKKPSLYNQHCHRQLVALSGISEQQVSLVVNEFKEIMRSSVLW